MQISSRFPSPQELFKQLEEAFSKGDSRPAEAGLTTPTALPATDSYEASPAAADVAEATEAADQQQESGGLRISYHFDLFYQLSQKVQSRMGQSGQDKFVETTATVAETFQGNFSLEIDGIGKFLKGTDAALNVSNETANEFLDAVQGLADLSPEALETFLKETDEFFEELEATFGEAGGAFDDIKATMQEQAKAFFDGVKSIRGESGEPTGTEPVPVPVAVEAAPEATTEAAPEKIKLAIGPKQDIEVSGDQYQEFIDSFLEYMRRYRETFLDSIRGADKPSEARPASSGEAKPAQPATADNREYPILPNMPNGKFPSGYFLAAQRSTSVFARFDATAEQVETPATASKLDTSA